MEQSARSRRRDRRKRVRRALCQVLTEEKVAMSALIPRIRKLAAVFAVVIVSAGGTATAAPVTAGSTSRVSTAQWQQTMQWLRAPGRGSSDVAVCTAPTRLLINNQPVQLASGGHTSLPGGGGVSLSGTTYLIQDAAMDSVKAAVITGNPDRINVTINLPHRPATLRGLLASAPHNPNAIQARNGTVLTPPFNFNQFYNLYGNSWRVPLSQSLLTACGKPPASTNPSNVYYAGSLPPKLAATARAECLAAGVPHVPPLLDACTWMSPHSARTLPRTTSTCPQTSPGGKINPP
jgi:hypothetical protein